MAVAQLLETVFKEPPLAFDGPVCRVDAHFAADPVDDGQEQLGIKSCLFGCAAELVREQGADGLDPSRA